MEKDTPRWIGAPGQHGTGYGTSGDLGLLWYNLGEWDRVSKQVAFFVIQVLSKYEVRLMRAKVQGGLPLHFPRYGVQTFGGGKKTAGVGGGRLGQGY